MLAWESLPPTAYPELGEPLPALGVGSLRAAARRWLFCRCPPSAFSPREGHAGRCPQSFEVAGGPHVPACQAVAGSFLTAATSEQRSAAAGGPCLRHLGATCHCPLPAACWDPGCRDLPSITAFLRRALLLFASPSPAAVTSLCAHTLPSSTDRGGFCLFSWGGLAQAQGCPRRLPSDTAPPTPAPSSSHLLPLSFRSL